MTILVGSARVPHTVSRVLTIAVGVFVAFELWAASTHAVTIAKSGYRSLRAPGYTVPAGDLGPLAYFASTAALSNARRLIPPDATYAVAVGPGVPPGQRAGVTLAFKFWLPPRRYVSHARLADWVIAYGQASERLGVRYTREIGLAPDVNLVKVAKI